MRASLCLFLISLLITQNFCATTKSQDLQFLDSIRRTDFGKTLLQSLQLTAKTHSKNAVESILVILNQMLSDENDAQAQADAAFSDESANCDSRTSSLQSEIDEANAQIVQNNVNIDILNSGIAGSQASLDEANDKLTTSTNALQNLEDSRASEHSQFLQNIADISATITALKQGREFLAQLETVDDSDVVVDDVEEVTENIITPEPEISTDPIVDQDQVPEDITVTNGEVVPEEEQIYGTSGFFQKNKGVNVFSQFTSHITRANLKKSTKYHGFVTALLTMLSRGNVVADQALVKQILNLIDQLVDQLSQELTTLAAAENDAQNIFETQQTYLSSDITNLNSQIADLQADITDKSAQVADLGADNSNLAVEVNNKSQELADVEQTCSDYAAAYQGATEQRAGEIDVISQVIDIFQTRFDNVQSYITESAF